MGISLEGAGSATSGNGARLGTAISAEHRPPRAVSTRYQHFADEDRGTGGERLSDFLGFFSLGLGLAQVALPGVISRVVGIDPDDARNRLLMRLMGLREISHGLAILSQRRPAKAVWSRVAGDALDLALLGAALTNAENGRVRTLFAAANVAAIGALDIVGARNLSRQPHRATTDARRGVIRTRRSVTIRRPLEDVYAFWRNLENLPRFMRHLESVTELDARRSRWVAKAPAGQTVEWEAEITEELQNERIAWRSLGGSDVYNAGHVLFQRAPGGRGTEVRLELEYEPPFGRLGSKIAMLFREEPGQQARDDLRHFKQVMETGEVVVSDATNERGPHAAMPDEPEAE